MPSDSDRTRAEQAAGETSTCEGVLLRLPAASRQGEAKGPGEQETPEKRGQEQNGKEVMVVVMYTLRLIRRQLGPSTRRSGRRLGGERQRLCGRGRRQRGGLWSGHDQDGTDCVGWCQGVKRETEALFPNAIITLDVCHVVEKLWELGHRFHKEGSEELKAWVEELKELVY